jgi:hypothetical protein
MNVARQFTAWKERNHVPSRRARYDRAGGDVRLACTTNKNWRRESYRTLWDGSHGSSIPGISCLATII